jgi:hypothetical protein
MNTLIRSELLLLENGWYDGEQGCKLSVEGVNWFNKSWASFYPKNMPLPSVFPTIEGNIQAEWSFGHVNVLLEIDLKNRTGLCSIMDMTAGCNVENDEELLLNFNDRRDWDVLVGKVQQLD